MDRSRRGAESLAKWLPPFQELSRCRKSPSAWWGRRWPLAAVGRKFKIEYLASNFHRSSKNHAVSYLAGGPASHPPSGPRRKGKPAENAAGMNGKEREGNRTVERARRSSPRARSASLRSPRDSRIGHAVSLRRGNARMPAHARKAGTRTREARELRRALDASPCEQCARTRASLCLPRPAFPREFTAGN